MNSDEIVIKNIDEFISETASRQIAAFRENNSSYKLFKTKLAQFLDSLNVDRVKRDELDNLVNFHLGIESEYMYVRGFLDSFIATNYLENGYMDKHIASLNPTESDSE